MKVIEAASGRADQSQSRFSPVTAGAMNRRYTSRIRRRRRLRRWAAPMRFGVKKAAWDSSPAGASCTSRTRYRLDCRLPWVRRPWITTRRRMIWRRGNFSRRRGLNAPLAGCSTKLSLGVRRKLDRRMFTGQTDTALGATAAQNGATVLGAGTAQKSKLTHTALLRRLIGSLHKITLVLGRVETTSNCGDDKRFLWPKKQFFHPLSPHMPHHTGRIARSSRRSDGKYLVQRLQIPGTQRDRQCARRQTQTGFLDLTFPIIFIP